MTKKNKPLNCTPNGASGPSAGSADFPTLLLAQTAAIRLAGHKDVTLTNKEISALFDCVPELRQFAWNACA